MILMDTRPHPDCVSVLLGELADNLTHVTRFHVGADAFRTGERLAAAGRTSEAAAMYHVAIHTAEVLAQVAASAGDARVADVWSGTAEAVAYRAYRQAVPVLDHHRHDLPAGAPA